VDYFRPPIILKPDDSVEVKAFDNSSAPAIITSAGLLTQLSTITTGTASNQRISDEVEAQATLLNLVIVPSTVAAAATTAIRVVLFIWNQDTAAAAPAMSDVILNTGNAANNPISVYNLDRVRKDIFSIVFDKLFTASAGNSTDALQVKRAVKWRLRFASAATSGAGHLYLLLVSDQAVNGPTVQFVSRLLYTDS